MPGRRYDAPHRRRGVRKGRERGCWVYIPAEELENASRNIPGGPPWYRLQGTRRGTVIVRLYGAA